ncbi:MAG: DUF4129 domain-containing protein [Haloarcula sp.]
MTVSGDGQGSIDWRQLALVSLCLVGLVVAAFLAPPPISDAGVDGDRSGKTGQASATGKQTPAESQEQQRDSGGDSDVGVTGGSDPIPIPGDDVPPTTDGCGVLVETEPKPGHTITVKVYQDLKPAASTRVWFNDQYIGQTDENGRVTGRIPYQRELNVTVESPGAEPCQFFRRPYEESEPTSSLAAGNDRLPPAASVVTMPKSVSTDLNAGRQYAVGPVDSTAPRQQTATDNTTGQYRVSGKVNISVLGEPYPDSAVTLVATVDGVPVRNANVSLDGNTVGRTDSNGQYQLRVPDRDRASVTVARGEFDGTERIDVLNLDVNVVPEKVLPVPGDLADINTTINGEPVENASIAVGGKGLGDTGADGAVRFSLPPDPTLTVTATTDRQSATTTLWDAYAGTVVVSTLVVVLTVVTVTLATLLYNRRVARTAGILWAVFDTLFFVSILRERDGLVIALAVVGVAALYHYRKSAVSGGKSVAGAAKSCGEAAAELIARIIGWSRRTALRLVAGIEAALDWVRHLSVRLTAWLKSLPLSLSALGRRFWQWLHSAGRRVADEVIGAVTLVRITAVGLPVAVVTLVHVRWGVAGAVVAGVVLGVASIAVYVSGRADGMERPSGDADPDTTDSVAASSGNGSSSLPSIRDLWRAFARWVVPKRWRTRTPGEVSRAAIDSGLPREPVEALTDAFREVEYGGQSTGSRRERAREAYDALVRASDMEDDE